MNVACPTCQARYDDRTHWTLCPHAKRTNTMAPLAAAGTARPSAPVSVFAEDFSLLIRTPRRLRVKRGQIRVLN